MHWTKAVLNQGLPVIWDYFGWMRKYAKHPEKYPITERHKKIAKLMKNMCGAFNVELYVEGKENIPTSASCIVANHLSSFDPLALLAIIGFPTTFVAKKEVGKMPFIGKCVKDIDGLLLDREDLKQSLRVMMKVQDDLTHKKDKNWIIFPEGTRNKDTMHNLKEFHHGTFRPAVKSGVNIVPVAIFGTSRVFKIKPQYKRYPVFIKFLKPITPEEYSGKSTQEIAKLCQDSIQREISFNLRKKDYIYMHKKYKKYRHNQNN